MFSIWTQLRYPHPPLNQSSYTIFSFYQLAGYLPHPASYFFGLGFMSAPGRRKPRRGKPVPLFTRQQVANIWSGILGLGIIG